MRTDIEKTLKNAKQMEVPNSTFVKVDNVLRNLEQREDIPYMKPKYKKAIALVATAAVIAIIAITYSLLPMSVSNSFTAQAYALVDGADGTPMRLEIGFLSSSAETQAEEPTERFDTDALATQDGQWISFFDGEHLYVQIFLDVTGENIESVEFSIPDGFFFAKQYTQYRDIQIKMLDGTIIEMNRQVLGLEFTPLGKRISLEDMQAENYSFFLAMPHRHGETIYLGIPTNQDEHYFPFFSMAPDILVDVTFNDGELRSEAITLDFGNRGGSTLYHPDLGTLGHLELNRISLDDAILIPESVRTLPLYNDIHGSWGVEMYVWEREGGNIFASRLLFRNPGDEVRYSLLRVDSNVVIAIVRLSDNGEFVGMEYILPDEIAMWFNVDDGMFLAMYH